jgi:hypothetical protein
MGNKINARSVSKSANYSADILDDVINMSASGGARTVTLPVPRPNSSYTVVKTDSSTNAVTVSVAGSGNTINGASSFILTRQHQSIVVQADSASNYRVVSGGASNVTTALTSAATISVNPTLGENFTLTPAHTATLNAASVGPRGQDLWLYVLTSGTTSYTLTFGTDFLSSGTLATGTVDAKTFLLHFRSSGTKWLEVSRTAAL